MRAKHRMCATRLQRHPKHLRGQVRRGIQALARDGKMVQFDHWSCFQMVQILGGV